MNKGIHAEILAMKLSRRLRNFDLITELDLSGASFSKQFKKANKLKSKSIIVIGDDEALKNEFIIRLFNEENFENMEDEIGDIIFTCLNLCRFNKINPDIALARSVKKFQNRSQKFFEILDKENIDTNKAWNKAKLITNESTK